MIQWLLVAVIVASTTVGDILQSLEMKRHGEIHDFRPGGLWAKIVELGQRPFLIWAVVCMAVSFFSFMLLLSIADLSFAVPATAASYVVETVLAKVILREHVNHLRWAGALLVAGGVVLLAV
jgi:drug/metabolite transporter (DMT)-like permease